MRQTATSKAQSDLMKLEPIKRSPENVQLYLFDRFTTVESGSSRALKIYDSVPIFNQGHARGTREVAVREGEFVIQGENISWEVKPAIIKDPNAPRRGNKRMALSVFPGVRENLIEQAIRKLIAQRLTSKAEFCRGQETEKPAVAFSISLYQLSSELDRAGHHLRLDQIREALDVLSGSILKVKWETFGNVAEFDGPIISKPVGLKENNDSDGSGEKYFFQLHPLASLSIWSNQVFTLNYTRWMNLKLPLARRIAMLLTVHFRQAQSPGRKFSKIYDSLSQKGQDSALPHYRLTMKVMLERGGIEEGESEPRFQKSKLRNRIRAALQELVQSEYIIIGRFKKDGDSEYFDIPKFEAAEQYVIDEWSLFEKEMREPLSGRGRPAIKDVEWALFASRRFGEEITADNAQVKEARAKASPKLAAIPA